MAWTGWYKHKVHAYTRINDVNDENTSALINGVIYCFSSWNRKKCKIIEKIYARKYLRPMFLSQENENSFLIFEIFLFLSKKINTNKRRSFANNYYSIRWILRKDWNFQFVNFFLIFFLHFSFSCFYNSKTLIIISTACIFVSYKLFLNRHPNYRRVIIKGENVSCFRFSI